MPTSKTDAKAIKAQVMSIQPLRQEIIQIRVIGDTPVITHPWSEKAKKMMLDTMTKENSVKEREPKNPVAEFIDSCYWIEGAPEEKNEAGFEAAVANGARFGIKAESFKEAAANAVYRLGWVKNKVDIKSAFFIDGISVGADTLVEIHSDTPIMREDVTRVGMGKPDLRYRPQFNNWYVDLTIRLTANGKFKAQDIINAINAGGYACGVGEWRPERGGQFGMFHVQTI